MPSEAPKQAASQDPSAPRGGTCSACAKAKVKCDKIRPKCGRCLRLGIDCNEQLRGRGRPPNSLRLNQDRAISHGWPGAGRVMFDANDLRPGQPFPFPFHMGDGVVIQPNFTLVDMIKASMQAVATSIHTDPRFKDGLVGDMRKKYLAILRWLHSVACVANQESLCDDVAKLAASFSLTEDICTRPFGVRPGLTIEAKREVKIPAFVAALNSGGSAFLVQVIVRGASVFFCNDDMASQFINAAEAEEEHATTKDDPGSVMRKIVSEKDRPAYLRAAARLLVHLPQLSSETSFMAHVMSREGNKVLCLVQMRSSFSLTGENVVMGTKLIPVPEPRPGAGGPGATGEGSGGGGGIQNLTAMSQFMMPFPMGQPGGGIGLPPNVLPFNGSMPWAWPMGDKAGPPKTTTSEASSSSSSSSSSTGDGAAPTTKDDEDDEETRARKRSEANWETRRKTNKKSRKDGEEGIEGSGEKAAAGEGEATGEGESYEEQQKNVRRRQLEKQQMEQVQLHYFQQMQLQHQQQLMASMGCPPFGGMVGFNNSNTPQVSITQVSETPASSSTSTSTRVDDQVAPPSETASSTTEEPATTKPTPPAAIDV